MEDRLADSLELSDLVAEIFTAGLLAEFPDPTDEEIDHIARDRPTRNLPRRLAT